jgi:antibiotic biosynthesis monooxygenase (ABM) superfamily enzyme
MPDKERVLTTVTTLIARRGREAAIERDFYDAHGRDGEPRYHLASTLIQQENGISFLVSQFRGADDLAFWRASPEYQRMIAAFEEHSLRELCTLSEPVVRVGVPGNESGPKWKVFVTTWAVVFPALLILDSLMDALPRLPPILDTMLSSAIVVATMVWIIFPALSSYTRAWRLGDQQMRISVRELKRGR